MAEIGDKATVPAWEWVDVKNEDRYGDHCGIDRGGKVEVLGQFDGQRLLVRYTNAGIGNRGTECRDGTIFLLDVERFAAMTERYKAIERAEKDERAKIRGLLGWWSR